MAWGRRIKDLPFNFSLFCWSETILAWQQRPNWVLTQIFPQFFSFHRRKKKQKQKDVKAVISPKTEWSSVLAKNDNDAWNFSEITTKLIWFIMYLSSKSIWLVTTSVASSLTLFACTWLLPVSSPGWWFTTRHFLSASDELALTFSACGTANGSVNGSVNNSKLRKRKIERAQHPVQLK